MSLEPPIVFVSGSRENCAEIGRLLRSVTLAVETKAELGDFHLLASSGSLLLVDYDNLSPADRLQLSAASRDGATLGCLLLISEERVARDLLLDLRPQPLTNLLARNGEVDADELLVTVKKLLRRDLFGIEKYFSWGVQPVCLRVTRSQDKERVLEEAEAFARRVGVKSRLIQLYSGVADEFLTNAVYNAPVDAAGQQRFGHLPRDVQVELKDEEAVEVKFCCDGRRLGISTTDPFGSLTKARLLHYLAKCFQRGPDQVDTKAGGAGLGLYQAFESLTHLVVNLSPGRRTEMIGLIDVRGTYRDFAARHKSLNIFTEA